jgi:hypothetical protein
VFASQHMKTELGNIRERTLKIFGAVITSSCGSSGTGRSCSTAGAQNAGFWKSAEAAQGPGPSRFMMTSALLIRAAT